MDYWIYNWRVCGHDFDCRGLSPVTAAMTPLDWLLAAFLVVCVVGAVLSGLYDK